jgi:hypothetical protein
MHHANKCTGRILSAFFLNVPVCLTPDKSHEELVAELLHVFIYFLAKMVQEMIHPAGGGAAVARPSFEIASICPSEPEALAGR